MSPRHRLLAAACVLAPAFGCATAPPSAESTSSFSMPSAPSAPSYVSSSMSTPGLFRVDAEMTVRPDQVCVPVRIEANAAEAGHALEDARDVVDDIARRTGARVRIDDVRTTLAADGAHAVVSAVVEHDLGDGDAFSRAGIVAAISTALYPLAHPAPLPKVTTTTTTTMTTTTTAKVAIGAPEPSLKHAEAHRQTLLDGWASRIAAMRTSIGGDSLELDNCQAPARVHVVVGSFEAIGLNLPISCTLVMSAHSDKAATTTTTAAAM